MRQRKTRSPLKANPLHNPGQSLERQRTDLVFDKLVTPLLCLVLLAAVAFMEWLGQLLHSPRQPWVYTIFALFALAYFGWMLVRYKPELSRLRLGIEGEKAVGQYLERLREQHYQVFHDVIGPGFNLDHVLVGPAGIFTVETKTLSKPTRGEAKIVFDGKTILVDGSAPDRDPVVQARAQAHWLKQLLLESTGYTFDVRPVVVFPGWYVEQRQGSTREVWVLEPKALPAFIAHENAALAPEAVKLASFHLGRFIRAEYL